MTATNADRSRVPRYVFTASQLINAGLLVLFIAGSLIFVGGRVAQQQSEVWPQLWDWPVFTVPGWLMVVVAAVGAVAVIPFAVLTAPARVPRLLSGIGQAFAAGCSAVIFAGLFPSDAGLIPMPDQEGMFVGLHWIAAALSVWCILVLIVAMIVKGGEYERLRKSGAALQ